MNVCFARCRLLELLIASELTPFITRPVLPVMESQCRRTSRPEAVALVIVSATDPGCGKLLSVTALAGRAGIGKGHVVEVVEEDWHVPGPGVEPVFCNGQVPEIAARVRRPKAKSWWPSRSSYIEI